jgi:ribosomal protein L37E
MAVSFKCSDESRQVGFPSRAEPCRCGRQVVDKNDGVCVMCGRLPATAIDTQWMEQSWMNRKQDRVRVASQRPFLEGKGGKLFRTAA